MLAGIFGRFGKKKKDGKKDICAMCGKETESAIFYKGKFFCTKEHLNQYKEGKKQGKSDEEICEFC